MTLGSGSVSLGNGSRFRQCRAYLLKFLGILLGLGLLYWTIQRTGAAPWSALSGGDVPWLSCGFLCIGLSHVIGGYRWGLGLSVQGLPCRWWLLYRLTLAGAFFSQLIPGAVSGDVLKLAWLVRQHPGRGAGAVMSGIVDRIVGVAGLFLTASAGGLIYWLVAPEVFQSNGLVRLALILVIIGGLAFLGGLWVLVYHGVFLRLGFLSRWVRFFGEHLPRRLVELVGKLCVSAAAYRGHPLVLIQILLLSMTIHFFLGVALFCIGRGLGDTLYSFGVYFLGLQLSNAVTLIPATPGGLGLRDSVSSAFFESYGGGDLAMMGTIPVVYSLFSVLWAMVGVWALLSLRSSAQRSSSSSPSSESRDPSSGNSSQSRTVPPDCK